MRRESSEVGSQRVRDRARRGATARRSRLRFVALDALEPRQLLATTPIPIVTNPIGITANGNTQQIDDSSPWVAVDPTNPLKLVTVFTNRTNINALSIRARASFSIDGGVTWSGLGLPGTRIDPATGTTPAPFAVSVGQGVGFDRAGNFYIGILQTATADGNAGSGVVEVAKYSFSGGSPVLSNDTIVYSWFRGATDAAAQPGIVNFELAVDNNVALFNDPTTGAQQSDPTAGNVYIAWTRNTPAPANPPNPYNPFTIELTGSRDGVAWPAFSVPTPTAVGTTPGVRVSGANAGNQRYTNPRLAVSQGRPGTVGGQVTVIWDDFGSGATATPRPFDIIQSRTSSVANTGTTPTITLGATANVTTTFARGNLTASGGTVASPASPLGIGPGASIAIDNTLGSYGLNPGRIYVTYASFYDDPLNQADNTDIFLRASDNGGATWTAIGTVQVNDDSGVRDGFSGGVLPTDGATSTHFAGRSQFQPSVAVDRTTGTLALGWLDARHDATRARTTFYLTASLDGGTTFSQQTFANTPLIVADAITGGGIITGPYADLNSVEASISVGTHQAIAIANGRITPVWSGTANGGFNGNRMTIRSAQASIPAGPRVESSTMGPIASTTVNGFTFNNTFSPNGHVRQLDGFTVTFDRLVDVATFDPTDVQAVYRNTTTPLTAPGTPIAVAGVTPLNPTVDGTVATTFFVRFAVPQTGVGTYSYAIGPDIRDKNRSAGVVNVVPSGFTGTFAATGLPTPVPDVATTTVPIVVSGAPATDVVANVTVNLTLNHTFNSDLIITLISPTGARVVLANRVGGSSADFINTTFDDSATVPIGAGTGPFTGRFVPTQFLSSFDGGSINGTWQLEISDVAALDFGTLQGVSLTIDGGTVVSGGGVNGNRMDQNADGRAGQADDFFSNPAPTASTTTRFVGPYDRTTAPIVVPGPHIASTFVPFAAATADNLVMNNSVGFVSVVFDRAIDVSSFTAAQVLSLIGPRGTITGPFTVTPEVSISPANGQRIQPDEVGLTSARSFRISFPFQSLSGTYTVNLGSGIRSTAGDLVDIDRDAGVELLLDIPGPGATTANVTYLQGAPVVLEANKTTVSALNVPDFFNIRDFELSLNITDNDVTDLEATLTDPNGTVYRLFTRVGNVVGNRANFNDTIFDNDALTPIQAGSAPFFGRFKPQDSFSPLLSGTVQAAGIYTLTIINNGAIDATLNRWSLTIARQATANTGLGELTADRSAASFRIFTMDPTNPLSSNTWTAVGPASNNGNGNSSRIGAIAIDPSDPSGNTAFVAGASGGVWKTYNFLTNDGRGPTYVPVTDYGPTLGINIGSIDIFPRNSDPRQSIVVAGTGEGDINGRGVGFLISFDGGSNWTLLDSTNNSLPFAQRDHAFVGTSTFKVLVDPKPSPAGGVIIYAALGGRDRAGNARGGIWRSINTGQTWQRVRAGTSSTGDATDLVFVPNSATVDAFTNPTGNIRSLFAGFLGDGVYSSPNQGGNWNQLVGGVGKPLVQDSMDNPTRPIPVNAPPGTPNGAKGRIVLAVPALMGNSDLDTQYQTWLYAAVSTPGGALDGLYQTKDNGQNWVKVRIGNYSTQAASGFNGTPVDVNAINDIARPDVNLIGNQGNYNIAIAIDPNNPNVVYLGGTKPATIRVDTTRIADAHALTADPNRNGGNRLELTTDPVTIKNPTNLMFFGNPDPLFNPFFNLLRDPNNPFLSNSTIFVDDTQSFTNSGSGATWTPFNSFLGGVDVHRFVTLKDPVTGRTRLVVGLDQGIFTGIDRGDGSVISQVGSRLLPTGSRNGNLQINQFYNGAAQPSQLAAQVAGALFYGMAQDNGFPASDPNILNNGNLGYVGSTGDGQDAATDQTGGGTFYSYRWPCCGGAVTNFFQVVPNASFLNFPPGPIGRTFGLIQQSQQGQVPDPQWPDLGGFNFAVNPISGDQIIMGSGAGRLFGTENQGRIWSVIAEPTVLDGTTIPALAYGAPDPDGPGVPGALNNYLLVGTNGGRIFATFVGGGTGGGNAWINISNGLSGGPVRRIITNPTRGSHEAYAITAGGIFRNADTSAANTAWVNITGDVFAQTHAAFNDPALTTPLLDPFSLQGLVADWRYVIPDDPTIPGGPTHPMLYVSGQGGVLRSTDNGRSWRIFPNLDLATPVPLGNLPVAEVVDLDLVLGNVDPTNGRPNIATGPNLLLATTYGRGSFGIRLAPIIFNDGINNVGSSVDAAGNLFFNGLSEQTAFGNVVTVTIADVTDPANPVALGTGRTDGFGRFSVMGTYPAAPAGNPYFYNGVRTVQVFATDGSGTKGNTVTFTVTNNPATPAAPILASPSLISGGERLTADNSPAFAVSIPNNTTIPVRVTLVRINALGQATDVSTTTITDTGFVLDPGPVPLGSYTYAIRYAVDVSPTQTVTSLRGPSVAVRIVNAPTITLLPADDSGVKGDNRTNVNRPRFFGTVPSATQGVVIELHRLTSSQPFATQILATIPAPNDGNYLIQPANPLADGTHVLFIVAKDLLGNTIGSNVINLVVKTVSTAAQPTLRILPADDTVPVGDGRTIKRRPRLTGTADPSALVNIVDATGTVQASVRASITGTFTAQLPFDLSNGSIVLTARATDVEGNPATPSVPLVLTIFGVRGDYNLDGLADLSIYRPSAQFFTRTSTGDTFTAYGQAGVDVPILGDFDGDGRSDVAVFRPTNDTWFISNSGGGQTVVQFGAPGRDTPVPGIYDAGGRTEVAVYRPDSATWFILHTNGQGGESIPFGFANVDKPTPADFDGVGFDQIAVYRPLESANAANGGGSFFIRGARGTVAFPGARAGDLPVPADYDGDRRADLALFRPSTRQYLIMNAAGQVRTVDTGAAAGAVPVPLDYTGDGRVDPAAYEPNTGRWVTIDSTTNQPAARPFGTPTAGDIAVPGPLTYRVASATGGRGTPVPSGSTASGFGSPASTRSASPSAASPTLAVAAPAVAKSKATTRPNDGPAVRGPVKLALGRRAQSTPDKDPLSLALSSLGRTFNGKYFG